MSATKAEMKPTKASMAQALDCLVETLDMEGLYGELNDQTMDNIRAIFALIDKYGDEEES